jgi:hypothetical protein
VRLNGKPQLILSAHISVPPKKMRVLNSAIVNGIGAIGDALAGTRAISGHKR